MFVVQLVRNNLFSRKDILVVAAVVLIQTQIQR